MREPAESSWAHGLAFDARTGELTLWFDHGGVYVYRDVPSTAVERLRASPSKGWFYQAHLRGRFHSECVAVAPAAGGGGLGIGPGGRAAYFACFSASALTRARSALFKSLYFSAKLSSASLAIFLSWSSAFFSS